MYIISIPRELIRRRTNSAEALVATRLGAGTRIPIVLGAMIKETLSEEMSNLPPMAGARYASSILDMVGAVMELHHGELDPASVQSALYRRAQDYIKNNIEDEDLSVDLIAAAMKVSSRTLSRAMALHGVTPMKCVWQMRLEASYGALREGNMRNVTEAAVTFGFCDLSHFSKAFKKTYGVTPQSLLVHR